MKRLLYFLRRFGLRRGLWLWWHGAGGYCPRCNRDRALLRSWWIR